MSYLLDTNACIAIINGRPQGVRRRLRATLTRGEPVAVSSIALFELWYGVAKSARRQPIASAWRSFWRRSGRCPSTTTRPRRGRGPRRARAGRAPIGAYDTLLAGQAIRRGLVLVTANVAEFARVSGLSCENWAE